MNAGFKKPLSQNPGVALGAAIGVLAAGGRDKLTFLLPEPISSFAMWLEQLIAESTGKDGTGVIPVSGDPVENRQNYGEDRLFVEFRIRNEPDEALEAKADSLRKAGHPVITVYMRDRLDLGEQFFLWEIATATAGALLRINPFDQPNVQETKEFTAKILDEVSRGGQGARGHDGNVARSVDGFTWPVELPVSRRRWPCFSRGLPGMVTWAFSPT